MVDPVNAPSVEDARSCLEQARQMVDRARFMWLKALESLEDAQKLRVSLHAQIGELANRGPFRPEFTTALLSGILGAAIEATGADMGNIQAYAPETGSLHIQVHRGFHEPFLEFFNSVDPGHAACGAALKSKTRVIVPDIANSSIFSGTRLLEVMLDAGIRAVQSTPLVGKSRAAWAAEIVEAERCAAHSDADSAIRKRSASKTPAGVLPSLED